MKKYFLFILISISAVFTANLVFSQRPSFEIYPPGGQAGPEIDNIQLVQVSVSLLTVSARIEDISGVSSAVAIIKDSEGNTIATLPLYKDEAYGGDPDNNIYANYILTSDYPTDIFTVDIFAVDNIGCPACRTTVSAGSFELAAPCLTDQNLPQEQRVSVCGRPVTNSPNLQDCVIKEGVCLKASVLAPDIPGLQDCVIKEGVCLKASVLAPDIPGLQDCVIKEGVCLKASIPAPTFPPSWQATQINPFTALPSTANIGQTLNLSATLTRADTGAALVGKTISFRDDTDNITIGTATTSSSGVAQKDYLLTAGEAGKILYVKYAGYPGHPSNHSELLSDYNYNDLRTKELRTEINISQNVEDYINYYFITSMYVNTPGNWQFAIDGDDAVEVEADGNVVAGYYSGHGFCGCQSYYGTINLNQGPNRLIVRHEEDAGGEGVILYYKSPSDANWKIFSASNLGTAATIYATIPSDADLKTLDFITNGPNSLGLTTTGTHTLKASYAGDPAQGIQSSYKTTNITVALVITEINPFSVDVSSPEAGTTINLFATLKKVADGTLLVGKTISFTDTTDSVNIGSAATNSSGEATVSYHIAAGASLDTHILRASYAGDPAQGIQGSYSEIDITVLPFTAPSTIEFTFATDMEGWTTGGNNGLWYQGTSFTYCGNDLGGPALINEQCQNYVNNWLMSPVLDLSRFSNPELSLDVWQSDENGCYEYGEYDQKDLRICEYSGGVQEQTCQTLACGWDNSGSWNSYSYNISSWAGKSNVVLMFRYNTMDSCCGEPGWAIDNVRIAEGI